MKFIEVNVPSLMNKFKLITEYVTEDGKYRIKSQGGSAQCKEVIEEATGKKIGAWFYKNTEDAKAYVQSLYE